MPRTWHSELVPEVPLPIELATVRRYLWLHEAHLAHGLLRSHGIHAIVVDSHLAHMDWSYTQAVGGIQVRVSEADVSRSQQLLDEFDAAPLPPEESDAPCPACGGRTVERVASSGATRAAWAASWVAFGFPVAGAAKVWRCATCRRQVED
jgi:predicted RNA-binding Zn-ribbon protein involved in translation (DUF1610 family)